MATISERDLLEKIRVWAEEREHLKRNAIVGHDVDIVEERLQWDGSVATKLEIIIKIDSGWSLRVIVTSIPRTSRPGRDFEIEFLTRAVDFFTKRSVKELREAAADPVEDSEDPVKDLAHSLKGFARKRFFELSGQRPTDEEV